MYKHTGGTVVRYTKRTHRYFTENKKFAPDILTSTIVTIHNWLTLNSLVFNPIKTKHVFLHIPLQSKTLSTPPPINIDVIFENTFSFYPIITHITLPPPLPHKYLITTPSLPHHYPITNPSTTPIATATTTFIKPLLYPYHYHHHNPTNIPSLGNRSIRQQSNIIR